MHTLCESGRLTWQTDVLRHRQLAVLVLSMQLCYACFGQVLDAQEALGVSRSMPIAIKGEAHDIHVDIRFPQDNIAGVDFGPLRVVDDCTKQLVLKNTEKYEVQFEFAVRSERVKQLVTITPECGAVLPNKEVVVTVSATQLWLVHHAVAAGTYTLHG